MIALLATYLLIFYVLIPGVLFRFPASLFIKLKLFQLTRTQEATFAVLVALLPYAAASLLVWHVGFAGAHPFGPAGTAAERVEDYQRAATLALTSDASKLFAPGQRTLDPMYWRAVAGVAHYQGRFLFWFYLLTLLEGATFGSMAAMYGDLRGRNPVYDYLTKKIVMPNISEWQTLLTDFTWRKKPRRDVYVDVLMKEAGLYQGVVANFFLDTNGRLSGIQLEKVRRFRRQDYEDMLKRRGEAAAAGEDEGPEVRREGFWTAVPGTNFYVPADQILNLNIRFPLPEKSALGADLQRELPALLDDPDLAADVTITEMDD